MLEVMGEHHVRTARAFGLRERVHHLQLRPADRHPADDHADQPGIGSLLSSAVFTEIIFARPGIGKLVVDAANFRNYPVVHGRGASSRSTLFSFGTLLADIVIARLDPRVRASL